VTFAVIAVKNYVVSSDSSRREAITSFGSHFPGVPIVLMAQDSRGTPTFWGRPDIVRFLSRVPVNALPWKRFSYDLSRAKCSAELKLQPRRSLKRSFGSGTPIAASVS
jgi:hypothetical protein